MITRNKRNRRARKQLHPASARQLRTEHLEQRTLLATVTGMDPVESSHTAPVTTNVAATFDENINGATATADNFVVHSSQRAGGVAVSADGMTITADPDSNFFQASRFK